VLNQLGRLTHIEFNIENALDEASASSECAPVCKGHGPRVERLELIGRRRHLVVIFASPGCLTSPPQVVD
jgi:hypothetical protein